MKRLLLSLLLAVVVALAVIATTTNVFSSATSQNAVGSSNRQAKTIPKNDSKPPKKKNTQTIAAHTNKPNRTSTTQTTTTATKQTTGSIKGQKVLFSYSGEKSLITPDFTVPPGGWNLKYSYSCNPADSLLQLVVYQGSQLDVNDLAPSIENQGVGKGMSVFYVDNGSFDVHVSNLGCKKWSITAITK